MFVYKVNMILKRKIWILQYNNYYHLIRSNYTIIMHFYDLIGKKVRLVLFRRGFGGRVFIV